MFKRGKANGHDTCLVYISKYVSLILVMYVVGVHRGNSNVHLQHMSIQ